MNEVSGETIVVTFDAGEARSANVTGGVEGIYRLASEAGGGETEIVQGLAGSQIALPLQCVFGKLLVAAIEQP